MFEQSSGIVNAVRFLHRLRGTAELLSTVYKAAVVVLCDSVTDTLCHDGLDGEWTRSKVVVIHDSRCGADVAQQRCSEV